jgi:predicted AAA+ superfamily ATPase
MRDNLAERLNAVLTDSEAEPVPAPTRRDVSLAERPGKIDAVIGMRRVGKSWLLLRRMRELLDAGVPRSRMLHVEFEDDRLADLATEDLHLLEETFYSMHPDSHGQECWFFFDEIQNAPGWEKWLRRLLGSRNLHLAITGSSAKLLSTEIATGLRGRALTTEVMPFSFREVLRHRGVAEPERWPVSQAVRGRLRKEFDRYLAVGGFPEVQDDDVHAGHILQGYLDVTILRDVVERHVVTNAPLLRSLVRRLLRSTANRVSVNSLAQDLKSGGFSFAKAAIYELMEHVQDAFLVFLLPVHSRSEKRRQVNPRKCYAIDHALVRACIGRRGEDHGHWLENIVHLELRRRGTVHGYHLTASGREVDFVIGDRAGDELHLVQACASLGNEATREREITALEEAIGETPAESATVVTLAEEAEVRVAGKRVRVVPAWRWLLE